MIKDKIVRLLRWYREWKMGRALNPMKGLKSTVDHIPCPNVNYIKSKKIRLEDIPCAKLSCFEGKMTVEGNTMCLRKENDG